MNIRDSEDARNLDLGDVLKMVENLADQIRPHMAKRDENGNFIGKGYRSMYPVLQGGLMVAGMLYFRTGLPINNYVESDQLIVDDIIRTGETLYPHRAHDIAVLVSSPDERVHDVEPTYSVLETSDEIIFPWYRSTEEYAQFKLDWITNRDRYNKIWAD
ncbi:MAG: hypothetical protein ABIH52_04610 [Candidatus Aenigmatarchaeota archaeon]